MSSDKSQQVLCGIGLSEAEATTYLVLLDMEIVSIRKIAEKTGINRGTTHDIIKRLVARGLVGARTIGAREYYSAESPEKILDLIRDQRKDLLETQKIAEQVVPALLSKTARPQGKPLVRFFEDDDGVAAILRDVLQTCRRLDNPEYYVYSSRKLRQYVYRKFPNFTERRVREGIFVKVIAVGEGGDPAPEAERKWIDNTDHERSSSYTLIYGNKMAQISISSDFTPYGVVIEDDGVAEMQRMLFERLWETL